MEVGFKVQADMVYIQFTTDDDARTSSCMFVNRTELVFGST